MNKTIRPEIKVLNVVLISTITIGAIAGVTDIIITNLDIKSSSIQAWLACGFLSVCLIALFVLGLCTTFDQYVRLGYPFNATSFKLKKSTWCIWFAFGFLINLALILSAIVLIIDLTKHHLASLPMHHSNFIGEATMVLAAGCFLHALFTFFSCIIWYRNFNRLLRQHNVNNHNHHSKMITTAAKGSGSLCELLLGWMLFAGGFIFTSLKLSGTINLHNALNQFISITLFSLGTLFLFLSFIGGHPPTNRRLKNAYLNISYITKGFKHHLEKGPAVERQLSSQVMETSQNHNTTIQLSTITIQTQESNQMSIDATNMETPSTRQEGGDEMVKLTLS
jgi:hypothetical protein